MSSLKEYAHRAQQELEALLFDCMCGDRFSADARQALCKVPLEAAPDDLSALAMSAIRAMPADATIDPVSLAANSGANGHAEDLKSWLWSITTKTPTPCCIISRAVEILQQFAMRKKFAEQAAALTRLATGPDLDDAHTVLADLAGSLDIHKPAQDLPVANLSNFRQMAEQDLSFVFEGALLRGGLSLLVAEGGIGKSHLALNAALSLALGRPLLRAFKPTRPGRSLLLFGEDDEFVIARRLVANQRAYSLIDSEMDTAIRNMSFVAGRAAAFFDFYAGGKPTPAFHELRQRLSDLRPDLLVIDPLAAWAPTPAENENSGMQIVANHFIGLARESNCAILILHHSNKQRAGELSQHAARGGSALVCASRWAAGMRQVTEDDAKRLEIAEECRVDYVELAAVKNNYAGRTGSADILRRVDGGALVDADLRRERIGRLAEAIANAIFETSADVTARELTRGYLPAKDARRRLGELMPDVTGTEIGRGIQYGLEFGLLQIDKISSRGQVREVLKPL